MTTPVELVRDIYADWERGDFSSVDWADSDIEYVHADGLIAGSWRGVDGMRGAFVDFLNSWHDWRVKAEDVVELDDGRIVVLFEFRGRGKTSGLDLGSVATKGANVFEVRDGRVTRIVQYFDRERALAEVGLATDQARGPQPPDNVAVVQALFAEWGRHESELAYRVFDEEICWDMRALPVEDVRRVFHGHEGVRAFWHTWLDAWKDVAPSDGPHHRAHGNQVISWWHQRNLGRASGLDVKLNIGIVWTFQSGRIVHAAAFGSREEAFRAAGLEP